MRVVKIAPGKSARYWSECEEHGYICVGWEKVGDLRRFDSREKLRKALKAKYYAKSLGTASRVAEQLWKLKALRIGDKVVANKGNSRVIAVGNVLGRYHWDANRDYYNHTVPVDWDTAYEKKISPQREWNNKTIADVDTKLFKLIGGRLLRNLEATSSKDIEDDEQDNPFFEHHRTVIRIHKAIERNQAMARKVKKALGYQCQACGFDFGEVYPGIAKSGSFIEAHHLVPIATLKDKKLIRYPKKDFAVLCANCHRMIHRFGKTEDLKAFRKTIKDEFVSSLVRLLAGKSKLTNR